MYAAPYKAHEDDHYRGEMSCKLCRDNPPFELRTEFVAHLNSVHDGYEFVLCPICGKEFETEHRLNAHAIHAHWRKFNCDRCRKGFINEELLAEHAEVCANVTQKSKEFSYTCPNCDRTFSSKASMFNHTKSCLTEEVICYQCDDQQGFDTRPAFYKHTKECHDGILLCHICKRTFNTPQIWYSHMQKHQQADRKCKFCSKTFLYLNDQV